ncbi:MAG TPA: translation initiation factor IF-3, partial [Anaerovoracaceae bacterium]|nr:translation initiation factor IF-3 [Anaerovoracaceae bacterium]
MSTFNKNQDRIIINHQIRGQKVFCINHENVNLGLIPLSQALNLAQEHGLDLVQVSAPSKDRAPTCKILDSGKYKYDLSKKKKEAEKKQREAIVKTKEIKFRPTTDLNDLKTKARKAEGFIEEGCRVKISITFKGREISHQE